VVSGGAIEEVPGAVCGVEGQGVVGFFDVAAGDVQDAVGVVASAFEHEDGVGGAGDAVGARNGGQEVIGPGLAHVVDEQDGDAVGVGEAFDAAHGGVVGVVGIHARRCDAADLGEDVDDDHPGAGVGVQPVRDVLLTTAVGSADGWPFTYTAATTIGGLPPTSGCTVGGDTVTIIGT
jgi:hypothetical protein